MRESFRRNGEIIGDLMDETDKRLVEALRLNARTPTAALARQLGISRSTVQSRIKRLEERGAIAGYTLRLSDENAARRIRAHVMLSVSPKRAARITHEIRKMPEATALYTISGVYDLIAMLATETMPDMDALIDRIGALDGVERTTTSILMTAKFER
jgi:DNA-binding Lrp family transcriptional regulator